jgi:hypothetical protein
MSAAIVGPARLVCSRALGWLGRARSGFALPEGMIAAQIDVLAVKAVTELGLAMSLVDREAIAGAEDAQVDSWRTSLGTSVSPRRPWREARSGLKMGLVAR